MDTLLLMKRDGESQRFDSRHPYIEAQADLIFLSQTDVLTVSEEMTDADQWTPWY